MILFAHNIVIYVVIAMIFPKPWSWADLSVIPALVLIVLNCIWVSLCFGILATRYRDIGPLLFSVVQWSSESSQNRTFKTEERLDKDLAVLADTSYRMRLSGVIALKGFLTKEHAAYHAQVLAALTNMLSTEKECSVRNAINQTIEEIDTTVVPVKVLKQNLISLAGYSRYLVQSGSLPTHTFKFFAGSVGPVFAGSDRTAGVGSLKWWCSISLTL